MQQNRNNRWPKVGITRTAGVRPSPVLSIMNCRGFRISPLVEVGCTGNAYGLKSLRNDFLVE